MAAEDLILCGNDATDSDNFAAAQALVAANQAGPEPAHIVFIYEPRQVGFGRDEAGAPLSACIDLLNECASAFLGDAKPPPKWALKMALGGLLTQADIARCQKVKSLTPADTDLLALAIKPSYGPESDATLHGRLTAWDQATGLAQWSRERYPESTRQTAPLEAFIDLETLKTIQNPVNLNFHHHEELTSRSTEEVDDYNRIMSNKSLQARIDGLRAWYPQCISARQKKAQALGGTGQPAVEVSDLNIDELCERVKNARRVRWFGGSSLRLLDEFISRGVAHKIECHIQAGSVSLDDNLFPNQFNVALNIDAAKNVFDNFEKFKKFTAVPSHAAQRVEYSAHALAQWGGDDLGRRIRGFNYHDSPRLIASDYQDDVRRAAQNQEVIGVLGKNADRRVAQADLTAVLYHFIEGYGDAVFKYAEIPQKTEDSEALLFLRLHEKPREGIKLIPVYDTPRGEKVAVHDMAEILARLRNPEATAG